MEGRDELLTIAELAIGIAGFSGVVAAFVQRDGLHTLDRNRFINLFVTSLSTLLLAFVPVFLEPIVTTPARLWQTASGAMIVALVLNFLISYRLVLTVAREYMGANERRTAQAILAFPAVTNPLVQLLNVTGLMWTPSFQAYLFGLLAYLYTAGFLFVYILLFRPRPAE